MKSTLEITRSSTAMKRMATLMAITLWTAQSPWAGAPPAPEGFTLGGDAAKGAAPYKQYCAMCHGDSGKGDGLAAAALNPKPKNLADKEMMAKISDWEIYLVIKEGGPAVGLSPMMTSWKAVLSDEQIRDVAAYVRSLAK